MEIGFYGDKFIEIDERVVPIQERGHQFGDGVYEVIRVYKRKPFLLDEHLERLEKSAEAILLKLPYSKNKIKDIVIEGINKSNFEELEVYLQITRGIAPRNHLFPDAPAQFAMTVKAAREIEETKKSNGGSVLVVEDERWANCYIKSLNLLPNVIAKQKAVNSGYDEAVFVRNGLVTEGSSSNVFAVKDGILFTTPATKQILHGITRAAVLNIASKLQLTVKEEHFTVDFFKNADEAFITSTSVEILPISTIDEHRLPVTRPVTKQLTSHLEALTGK